MPRVVRPWFRVYVEMVTDRKIRRLSPTQRWVWVAVLAAARESHEAGALFVAENEPMTIEELAQFADVSKRETERSVATFERYSMVDRDQSGLVTVRNWGARQFESDDVTKRTQAHRERSNERSHERSNNVRGNTPETETETETEKKTSSSSSRKRATQVSPDWKPTEADVSWQRAEGISDLTARRELPIFVDHWRSKAETRADWSATWRNWLRRAGQYSPPAPVERKVTREW